MHVSLQAVPLDGHAGVLEVVGAITDGVSTTEARLVATVGLLLVAALAAGLVVPLVARGVRNVATRTLDRQGNETLREAVDAVPWGAALTLSVRLSQLAVVALTGVGLLVVWGQVTLAVEALLFLERSAPVLLRGVTTLALLAVAYVGTKLLEERIQHLSANSKRMDQHEEGLLLRVSQLLVFSLVTLVGLSIWEVNLGGLLVGAGFLGIVFGMAARQTLGSLVAGFVLMLSRPFEIGDWVLVDDQQGIVTDVTVINTHLRNFDGEFVVIPNDRVANSVVTVGLDPDRHAEGGFQPRL
jgi:small-conductance mechanosensitive channel